MSSASSRRPSEAIAASPFYENEFQYEICDCANCCLCLNAFWCPGVVWAQIMTRLKFNSLGFPDARGYKHTFGIFVGLWVVYLISYSLFILKESCVNAQEAARQQSYGEHTSTVTAPQHCYTNLGDIARIVSLICLVFMFLVKVMARNSFRRRARIQGVFCCCNAGICDDCLCVYCCGFCTAIQLVRETQGDHPYNCCNSTGLPAGVEINIMRRQEGVHSKNSKYSQVSVGDNDGEEEDDNHHVEMTDLNARVMVAAAEEDQSVGIV